MITRERVLSDLLRRKIRRTITGNKRYANASAETDHAAPFQVNRSKPGSVHCTTSVSWRRKLPTL
ncbi:hypothetical protein D9M72_442240 [compost metagenome]